MNVYIKTPAFKLHKNLKISNAIKILSKKYLERNLYFIIDKRTTPKVSDINNGWCYCFAESLRENFPEAKIHEVHFNNIPHAFVEYKGKYYDSETPKGVKNWKKLPIFRKTLLQKLRQFFTGKSN